MARVDSKGAIHIGRDEHISSKQFHALLAEADFVAERKSLSAETLAELDAPKTVDPERARLRAELFQTGSEFKPTSRDEIIGIDNVLGEIEQLIHWLRHSKEYEVYKSRLQPGVIFAGDPGTGKTLVSRWIATESNALFVNVRDFPHDGALFTDSDIRDLFRLARERYAEDERPVILFWDEFENSAVERGSDSTTPEQRSVVSQLTAELDGIHGKNEGLLLVGCTNYVSSIDSALMRRGRMGLQIEFHAPDRAGKEKILRYYLSKMNTASGVDYNTLSYFFARDDTAADIEEACVEAWRHAVSRSIQDGSSTPLLTDHDLVKVFIKQLVGPPTTFVLPDDERLPIAIHESGHAMMALICGRPLRLITVQPGKKSLGRVMTDDLKEYISTIPEVMDALRVTAGGFIAERVAGLVPMTGCLSDLRRINSKAHYLVDNLFAGGRTGLFDVTSLGRQSGYSNLVPQICEKSIADSDADVREIIEQVEEDTSRMLSSVGGENIVKIAEVVNQKVTMTGREFEQLFIEVCGFSPETVRTW